MSSYAKKVREIASLMKHKERIRNIGIIAHIDHGKTTLTDMLLAAAGLLSPELAGEVRALDYLEEEQKRGITIKTANISLVYSYKGDKYLINLIDTPGHVDFSGKVMRALRAIDGAIVVVDAVEGVMVQTEIVTRQALIERVKPILFINKLDRLIRELKLPPDKMRKRLEKIIRDFNSLISMYGEHPYREKWRVSVPDGSVVFGSALHKWGFTAEILERKGLKVGDIIEFYNKDELNELQKLLPVHEAVLDAVIKNLPDPISAQSYRIPKIWPGNLDSEIGHALLNCDENGPTVICVTKILVDPHAGNIVVGRVFSGEVHEGDPLYAIVAGEKARAYKVSLFMGPHRYQISSVPAGNIVAFGGFNEVKVGDTIVEEKFKDFCIPFETIKYLVEPVVTVSLEPERTAQLEKMLHILKELEFQDPNLSIKINEETGECLLSGLGELHLEITIKELEKQCISVMVSPPIVSFRESVKRVGSEVVEQSSNLKNEIKVRARPLSEDCIRLLSEHVIPKLSRKRSKEGKFVVSRRVFEVCQLSGKIWAITHHPNILVSHIPETKEILSVKDQIIEAFEDVCKSGPLCGETLRGVLLEILDLKVSRDPSERDPLQIIPMAYKAFIKSLKQADLTLLEPIYRIQITAPQDVIGKVLNLLNQRKGDVERLESDPSSPLIILTGYIPVRTSFGLSTELRSRSSGRAFLQMSFSHWAEVPSESREQIIRELRARRGELYE